MRSLDAPDRGLSGDANELAGPGGDRRLTFKPLTKRDLACHLRD